jgi:hypothetical protein
MRRSQKLQRVEHNGGIAQLGERLHGMQEVIGSIPFTSTINARRRLSVGLF